MTILKITKTRLEALKGQWADELPRILWAYRTTPRIPTGETPYTLAFGCEAVIPVEIGMVSLRIQKPQTKLVEKELHLNLDLIEERQNEASLRMATYQQRMMRYHNAGIYRRGFQSGELVLWKVSIATQVAGGPYSYLDHTERLTTWNPLRESLYPDHGTLNT